MKNINSIMEKLLASLPPKPFAYSRGAEVTGEIITITDREVVLDLGVKSEGVILIKDISKDVLESLKVGVKFSAYVIDNDSQSGQIILSAQRLPPKFGNNRDSRPSFSSNKSTSWNKFINLKNNKTPISGKVVEVNKGGLIIEVDGVRGFLPSSLIGFEFMKSITGDGSLEGFLGQNVEVIVSEVEGLSNRLIFSGRGQVSSEIKMKLKNFKPGQRTKGQVIAILPFGLILSLDGELEGVVFIGDVSWEKTEDLSTEYAVGQDLEVIVISKDEDLGRINLSIKQLSEDPFGKRSEKYEADSTVKGTVESISASGINISLEDGTAGFIPTSKVKEAQYEVGQTVTLTVDNVDKIRRRVNLAPFITSTKDLIYK